MAIPREHITVMSEDMDFIDDDLMGLNPPRPGTPESWREVLGGNKKILIICPEEILGRAFDSMHKMMMRDPQMNGAGIFVVPPISNISLSMIAWMKQTIPYSPKGIIAFIQSERILEGDIHGIAFPLPQTHFDLAAILNPDPASEMSCSYEIIKGEDEGLKGRISFI